MMMRFLTPFLILSTLATLAAAAQPNDVAANVNGQPITAGEVNAIVAKKLAAIKSADPALEARWQAEVLQGLVDFHLLKDYFKASPNRATDEQVAAALESLRKQLTARDPNMTVDKLATAAGQTPERFREEVLIKLSVNKEIASTTKPSEIEEFFNTRRTEFDGSELRVGHILMRPLQRVTPEELLQLEAQATAIREAILAGKLTWAAAVEKYSQGPSRDQGGDLGWIRRDGPMLESFNRAAYALRTDDGKEISPPIITPFGIHLIRRTGSVPGTKTLQEVRPQVEAAFLSSRAIELLKQIQQAGKVEYTGKLPYYKPGTRELVLADK